MAPTPEDVYEFIGSREFLDAWTRVNDEPISFVQFARMPMPNGCTPEWLWKISSILRRHAGTTLPFSPYFKTTGDAAWFSVPTASQTELTELCTRTAADSPISIAIASRPTIEHILKPLLVDEVFSLSRRDGLHLTRETVRALWLQQRTPRSAPEMLIANASHAFDATEAYISRTITRGLIEELHEKVIEGVGRTDTAPVPRFSLSDRGPYEDADYTLGIVKTLAASTEINPIYSLVNMMSMFWDLTPFKQGNALTELIVRRIYLFQRELPALAYTSISHTLQRWEEGRPSFTPGFSFEEITTDSEEGLDATIYHAVCVRALLYEINKLRDELRDIEESEARYSEILDNRMSLNARQKDILMRVLHDPDMVISIDDFRRTYGVVYATGRSDLLRLVDLGFLSYHKSGRKFVFQGIPHLSELLDDMR